MNELNKILEKHNTEFHKILPFSLQENEIFKLDLSATNSELEKYDILDTENLSKYIQRKLNQTGTKIAIGGYAENRIIYKKSKHFGQNENARTIHLGIDIWCNEYTPIYAPMHGIIHSFKINNSFGDYGPTIILEHTIDNRHFYTLYGHLSTNSLKDIKIGQTIGIGEQFAEIGNDKENGEWPPHLHFQVIADMKNNKGDFPGVCSKNEMETYLKLCPDPSLILTF